MAQIELSMPKMGESVAEATVIRWLKNEGDLVMMDEVVLEIATDKVDSEIPSTVHGRLIKKLFSEDDVVKIGEVLAIFDTDINTFSKNGQSIDNESNIAHNPLRFSSSPGVNKNVVNADFLTNNIEMEGHKSNGIDSIQNLDRTEDKTPSQENPHFASPDSIPGLSELNSAVQSNSKKPLVPAEYQDRFYSPLVRSIAQNEGITKKELDTIHGTGGDGRVTKQDILNHLKNKGDPQVWDEDHLSEPVLVNRPQANANPVARISEESNSINQQDKQELNLSSSIDDIENKMPANPSASDGSLKDNQSEQLVNSSSTKIDTPLTRYTNTGESAPISQPKPAKFKSETSLQAFNYEDGDEIIEMDRMRRLIAEHMIHSKETSAHVTSFIEADVSNIVIWREKIKDDFRRRENEGITFTPIFIEAVAKCLKDFPMINVSVIGKQIIIHKHINIGMATSLPSGNLIVPVIKNADQKNLVGLTKAVNDLANRARIGKLIPDEINGGTFTVTNLGSFGNIMGTPIINQPQVAILAVGAIQKKPAVVETVYGDVIAIRHKMFLSLSYDHRVVDGALGGHFLKKISDSLESFDPSREF